MQAVPSQGGGVQLVPLQNRSPAGQRLPHLPQLSTSLAVLTQLPSQQVSP
jgi:hypothetical protein